jgi:hypothetical protein
MRIIGCDLHARQQTLAILETTTGEVVNLTLMHEGNAVREFYSQLPRATYRARRILRHESVHLPMIRSRLNWLLVPVAFAITYEASAWALWVPLSRSAVAARNGTAFIPYWEGQVFAFAAIRIIGAMFVFLFCFLLPPLNRG